MFACVCLCARLCLRVFVTPLVRACVCFCLSPCVLPLACLRLSLSSPLLPYTRSLLTLTQTCQHVFGLEVSVDEAMLVQALERHQHLEYTNMFCSKRTHSAVKEHIR